MGAGVGAGRGKLAGRRDGGWRVGDTGGAPERGSAFLWVGGGGVSFAGMKVRLLLFAAYRDLVGTGEVALELPAGARARDAVASLRSEFSRLPERPVVAINREFSALEDELRDGDELALLPPVAGG